MKICAVSDLHDHMIELPKCEVLVIAGDISMSGGPVWFEKVFIPYLVDKKYDICLLIFGNHDDGIYMNAQWKDIELFLPDNVKMLNNKVYKYKNIKFYGSPNCRYIPGFLNTFNEEKLKNIYSVIPDGIDILITHSPPYGVGDIIKGDDYHLGSVSLMEKVRQIKPKVHIFGHIHTGKKYTKENEIEFFNVSVTDETYDVVYKPTTINWR
jgi:Icc-related predicted phosphoesterase